MFYRPLCDIIQNRMKKNLLMICLLFSLLFSVFGQSEISEKIEYNGSYNYTLRERTDLRRYDNGKYTGLVRREVTSFITPTGYHNGYEYEGSFFVNQDTVHSNKSVGFGIRESIPSSFRISNDGILTMIEDNGFPSFRSFPTFSNKQIKIGDTWTGKAERAVDPLFKGIITKMPIYVQYKYLGDDFFNDESVYLLSAQWATRYGMGSGTSYIDWGGDKDLEKATGSHKATIYVSKISGNALVIRDTVDETYTYADGNVVQFKGQIALFTEYPPAIDRSKLLPALKRLAELSDDEEKSLAMLTKSDTGAGNPLAGAGTDAGRQIESDIEKDKSLPLDQALSQKSSESPDENAEKIKRHEDLTRRLTNYMENNKKQATNKNQIAVDATPAGIRLSIQNLQFKANSPELVESETSRLNQIAEVLNTVPEAQLLVEGHTARVGNEEGEMELSLERARTIAEELTKRGVSANRFICKGHAGKKPIADNSTTEGRALNRRVEITILD